MPEDRRLATLARDGIVLDDWLERIAEALVAFHNSAARSPEISVAGTGASLRAGWEANFAECDRLRGRRPRRRDRVRDPVTRAQLDRRP